MNANQAKYPQLRFKGFTDPWDKRYLGDYVVDYTEKTTQENQFPVLTSSQQQGIVLQSEYFSDRQVTTDENIGYFVLPRGYFTYRSRSDNNIFVFNRNDIIDKGIISYFYPVFGLINADSNFFLRRINNGLNRQLAIAAEGTGQHVLSLKKFKKMETRFPSLPEQKQIGEFLECLDDLITVNQRKLAKLKELKQGYLQKLFPKNGSKFPQLRFAGFADAWEQRKFESLLNKNDGIRRGPFGSALKKEFFVPKSEYVVYEQQNAIYDNYKTRYNITKKKFDELSRFELRPNDFIMSGAGTIGRISRVPNDIKKGVFNQALIRFRINTSITDSEYFVQFIRADFMQRKLTNANPGSAITNLVPMSEVKNWIIQFPNLKEQQKIGTFFQQLDQLITLHQRKLEKLQELKKGYLQKMFC